MAYKDELITDRAGIVRYTQDDWDRVKSSVQLIANSLHIPLGDAPSFSQFATPSREDLNWCLDGMTQILDYLEGIIPASSEMQQVQNSARMATLVMGTAVGNGVLLANTPLTPFSRPEYPTTYDYLTTNGANQIEQALYCIFTLLEEWLDIFI